MSFSNSICNGKIVVADDLSKVVLTGRVNPQLPAKLIDNIQYTGATPGQRNSSFTGSMLPWPNASQAFDNTPIKGTLTLNGVREFSITIPLPNSYYAGLGTVKIPPTLYLQAGDIKTSIILSQDIQIRSLTYPMERKDVMFYDGMWELPVRTQEEILRSAAFNTKSSKNFWGLKPPN